MKRTLIASVDACWGELAWRAGERERAAEYIREAIGAIGDRESPLAAWQVCDCAADILSDETLRARAAEALIGLGGRMESPDLREVLFSTPRAGSPGCRSRRQCRGI